MTIERTTPSPPDFEGSGQESSETEGDHLSPVVSSGDDPILKNLAIMENVLSRLNDHALAGYSLMTTTRSHMNEISELTSVKEYFEEFYKKTAREFIQRDDYAYTTHHCLRALYGHWQEEFETLNSSSSAASLKQFNVNYPKISKPTQSGRVAFAPVWHEKIRDPIETNKLPAVPDEAEEDFNPIIPKKECVFSETMNGRDWGRLLNR